MVKEGQGAVTEDDRDAPHLPDLYARTYMTLLRSSGIVRVHALEAAHARMRSSLHALADQPQLDAGAFIYAMQRLPLCVARVTSVVVGQEGEQFRANLGDRVEAWERVEAAARRRAWRWDGADTLTVHASSPSDLDDVVPCLVAYQVEWNKLHAALAGHSSPGSAGALAGRSPAVPDATLLAAVGDEVGMATATGHAQRGAGGLPPIAPAGEGAGAPSDAVGMAPATGHADRGAGGLPPIPTVGEGAGAPGSAVGMAPATWHASWGAGGLPPTSLGVAEGVPDASLGDAVGMAPTDWARLAGIWGDGFVPWLREVAAAPKDMSVRLLGGNDVAYARLARRWWRPIAAAMAGAAVTNRPTYLVSSNLHAIVNLVSGYARRRRAMMLDFLLASVAGRPGAGATAPDEVDALVSLWSAPGEPRRRAANLDNVLYYASRLWHQAHRDESLRVARRAEEAERGIVHVDAVAGFDVGAQVIDLSLLRPGDLDPRLARHADVLARSDAVVLNVDYPLGLASYHIVREVLTACPLLAGIYAIGKAATLNAAVGDVLLSDTVFDEHSGNSYAFPNAFRAGDLDRFLDRASALDNQSAVTVRGTFLQNHASLGRYYGERFTVVEMEAGPILSAVYEATRPDRHPSGQRVYFRELPFDFGIIHYASDTPYTQARTLGSRGLSVEGIDATYAAALAVLDRILVAEGRRTGLSS